MTIKCNFITLPVEISSYPASNFHSPGPGAINLDEHTFDRSLTFTLHVYSLQKSETYIKSEFVYVLWPLGQNYTRVYSYQINILEFLQYPLFCFDQMQKSSKCSILSLNGIELTVSQHSCESNSATLIQPGNILPSKLVQVTQC